MNRALLNVLCLVSAPMVSGAESMQREIEDMLEMLIDALRQQIEQNEAYGGEP